MNITINTDGGFTSHPSVIVTRAAISFIIRVEGIVNYTHSSEVDAHTNNQAEYLALLKGLKYITDNFSADAITNVEHISDSKLLVEHFNETYKVKEPELIELMKQIKGYTTLLLNDKVTSRHVKRSENSDADWLCNLILDKF